MKATEVRAMTVEQLNEKLDSLKKAETKRDIARVKTVIREKEEK